MNKKQIEDTIYIAIAVFGITFMVCAMYELNELQKDIRELKIQMSK